MFLAVVLAAMPIVTPPEIAAGTYSYHSSIGGQPAATSTIVVKRTATNTEIDEQSSGTIGGMSASAKATLVLGADLAPASYTGSYVGDGQSATTTLSVAGTTASLTGPAGPQSFTLLAPATHFAVIDAALLAGFIALPAQMQAWNDAPIDAIAPIYGRATPLATLPTAAVVRPAGIAAKDVALAVGGPYPFTLWYDPTTLVTDELEVPSQNIVVTRTP
ncbi:MAG TPA: hypothetical protein VMW12_11315 [Candidatus Dormibacteraeota bacterium]|nr:hypothetical protein [Candidatus Dormibacteraeota bacterium]